MREEMLATLKAMAKDMMSGASSEDECQAVITWAYMEIVTLHELLDKNSDH